MKVRPSAEKPQDLKPYSHTHRLSSSDIYYSEFTGNIYKDRKSRNGDLTKSKNEATCSDNAYRVIVRGSNERFEASRVLSIFEDSTLEISILRGSSLDNYFQFSTENLDEIAYELGAFLAMLRKNKFTHGDLKPKHVFWTQMKRIGSIDFEGSKRACNEKGIQVEQDTLLRQLKEVKSLKNSWRTFKNNLESGEISY